MPDRIPFRVKPMLATLVDKPFHRPGWVYEEKYDGYRILAYKEEKRVTLLSRNGKDHTESFADVAKAVATLRDRTLLLDGEAVAFDRRLVSRFQLLQQGEVPVVFAAFDCLYRNGRDLREKPLWTAEILETVIGENRSPFRFAPSGPDGLEAFRLAQKKGFEGMVAKNGASVYVERRSREWLKVKVNQEEEFVIGGYTARRAHHFGALLPARTAEPTCATWGAWEPATLRRHSPPSIGASSRWSGRRRRSPIRLASRERPGRAQAWSLRWHSTEWTDEAKLRQPVFLDATTRGRARSCCLRSFREAGRAEERRQ